MAEAAVLEYNVLEQAAEWFAVLEAPDARAADREAWKRWLAAAPEHGEAWRRVEAIHHQINALPGAAARMALASGPRRRRAIKALLLLCAGGGVAGLTVRPAEVRQYLAARNAGHRTGIGKVAVLPLPDQTKAWLNTDSAADVAYEDSQRMIVLRRGEILLHSGADAHTPSRPLVVEARGQRLRALGTRFAVRMTEQGTRLAVYQGAVEIGTHTVVPAGAQVDIVDGHAGPLTPAGEDATAWSRRLLIATQMRLDDFLRELGRYRHGHLGCDPSLSELRVVGSYPLDDTDLALSMLRAALPVQIKRPLSWWVTVAPR